MGAPHWIPPGARRLLRRARRSVGKVFRLEAPGTFALLGGRIPRVRARAGRADQVLVVASAELADLLEPEWSQITRRAADVVAAALQGVDVVLLEWTGGRGTAHDVDPQAALGVVADAARAGVPLVVWDTAAGDGPTLELADGVAVFVRDRRRLDRYGATARPLEATVSQVRHNPIGRGARFKGMARLLIAPGAGAAATLAKDALAGIGFRVGPARSGRRWAITVSAQHPADLGPTPLVLAAAASGSVIVTTSPAVADRLAGSVLLSDPAESEWVAQALARHPELRARRQVQSLRSVHSDWSARSRADQILAAAGREVTAGISAVVPTSRPAQLDNVLESIGRQVHPQVELVLVTHGFEVSDHELAARAADHGITGVQVVPADRTLTLGACMNLGVAAAGGAYVAKMDDDNYYGRHYLSDLVRAFDYTDAQVVGKWAHLAYLEGSKAVLLRFPRMEHRYSRLVQGGTLLMRRELARELRFEDLPRRVDTTFLDKVAAAGGRVYSTDRFGFVSVRHSPGFGHTWAVSDQELMAKPSRLLFFGEPWDYAEV